MSRLNELRYNHLKFDLKFSWRGVYRPPQRAQQVKNGPSVPGLGEEREVDFAMRKRKKVWEKPGLELGLAKTASRVIGHWLLVLADAGSRPVRRLVLRLFLCCFSFWLIIMREESSSRLISTGMETQQTQDLVLKIGRSYWVSDCEREGEELLISDMNGFLPTNLPLTIS